MKNTLTSRLNSGLNLKAKKSKCQITHTSGSQLLAVSIWTCRSTMKALLCGVTRYFTYFPLVSDFIWLPVMTVKECVLSTAQEPALLMVAWFSEMEWNADCWIISIVYFKSLNRALTNKEGQTEASVCEMFMLIYLVHRLFGFELQHISGHNFSCFALCKKYRMGLNSGYFEWTLFVRSTFK